MDGGDLQVSGLTVGIIQHDQPPQIRRQQYACDISYGTNAEFGFDYLRDNGMATSAETQVQRGHFYAIVDEVDSILIDEARTPLIIAARPPSRRRLRQIQTAGGRIGSRPDDVVQPLRHRGEELSKPERQEEREQDSIRKSKRVGCCTRSGWGCPRTSSCSR